MENGRNNQRRRISRVAPNGQPRGQASGQPGDNEIDSPVEKLKALKDKDSQERQELGVLMGEEIFR